MAKIGIDFGTTNSLIVAYDKNKSKFSYFNYEGDIPVPTSSTVWYNDNKVIVGDEARKKMYKHADDEGHHFEKSVKLKLGSGHNLNVFGKPVEPYKVAARILRHIKTDALERWQADKAGADLNSAVFTVPINYNGKQRRDLRKSAHEAGIEVTTFIHEPFAAIVGYYFAKEDISYEKVIKNLNMLDGQHILTFDWGGGTLDITVVQINKGKMCELGTAELTDKAGDKFDEDIATYVWNLFLDKYGKNILMTNWKISVRQNGAGCLP